MWGGGLSVGLIKIAVSSTFRDASYSTKGVGQDNPSLQILISLVIKQIIGYWSKEMIKKLLVNHLPKKIKISKDFLFLDYTFSFVFLQNIDVAGYLQLSSGPGRSKMDRIWKEYVDQELVSRFDWHFVSVPHFNKKW